MSELTANEATALMAAGMYASPPTEAQMKDGIERAESWLAAHDREVKAAALREAADVLVRDFPMRWASTGKYPSPGYDPEQAENAANAVLVGLRRLANRIESEAQP